MNRNEQRKKAVAESMELALAITIQQAIEDLIDVECPHCFIDIYQPSLEDIQEWLKEEK